MILGDVCSHFVWESGMGVGGFSVLCFLFVEFSFYFSLHDCFQRAYIFNFCMNPNLPSRSSGITFTSWNMRGLGHVLKRAKYFHT